MREILITTLILFLSVAPAAADGIPTPPAIPAETGEELCKGELKVTEADFANCEAGLSSCAQDRAVWLAVANECLGLPIDASIDDAKKKLKKLKEVPVKPKRKRKVRRKVSRKQTPKSAPMPVKGDDGADGEDGADGKDGHSLVWSLRSMPPGKTCSAGGRLLMFGIDSNDNGALDPTEATDLMAVCHGKDGRNGKDGDDGVRPTVGVGTFTNALFAHNRPNSFATFAVASLGWPLNDSVSLTIEGGAAPGRDAAMMLRASLDFRLGSASGLKIGGIYEVVGLTDNNYANDQFSLLSVGVYKDLNLYSGNSVKLNLRGELSGLIGVDGFINSDRKIRKAYGVGGGLGLRFEF